MADFKALVRLYDSCLIDTPLFGEQEPGAAVRDNDGKDLFLKSVAIMFAELVPTHAFLRRKLTQIPMEQQRRLRAVCEDGAQSADDRIAHLVNAGVASYGARQQFFNAMCDMYPPPVTVDVANEVPVELNDAPQAASPPVLELPSPPTAPPTVPSPPKPPPAPRNKRKKRSRDSAASPKANKLAKVTAAT